MLKKNVSVTWLTGMTFDAEVGDHHVFMDSSGDSGDNRAPSPVLLSLAAVGGCTAMDVVSILRKKRQPFDSLVVHVEAEQAPGHPHRLTDVVMTYEVTGEGVDPKAVARSVDLSEEKYCSVSSTFKEQTNVLTRVVVNGEEYATP
ncbi:MAG: OsmC family protein [Anaerolineae bacterium]